MFADFCFGWLITLFGTVRDFLMKHNFFESVDSTKWFFFAEVLYTNIFAGDKIL